MQKVVPFVVRLVRVVYVVLGLLPVVAHHLVQHFALGSVAEDMGAQVFQDVVGLLPQLLGAARPRSYPEATVQAHEPSHHCPRRSPPTSSVRELGDTAGLLVPPQGLQGAGGCSAEKKPTLVTQRWLRVYAGCKYPRTQMQREHEIASTPKHFVRESSSNLEVALVFHWWQMVQGSRDHFQLNYYLNTFVDGQHLQARKVATRGSRVPGHNV